MSHEESPDHGSGVGPLRPMRMALPILVGLGAAGVIIAAGVIVHRGSDSRHTSPAGGMPGTRLNWHTQPASGTPTTQPDMTPTTSTTVPAVDHDGSNTATTQ